MTQKTCLHATHVAAGAKIVDFSGWEMPLHYGSQLDEHHAVRRGAGLFDVSHMCAVDVCGDDANAFMRRLLANDVDKIAPGRALYSCMLNPQGGVVDDLIVYRMAADEFRIVVNAGTAPKDIDWMHQQAADFSCAPIVRRDLGVLALQGPKAGQLLLDSGLRPERAQAALELKPFGCLSGEDFLLGRTGYTGEDGFEIIAPLGELPTIWERLIAAGAQPCGLGARDTLRLEAGMALYGQDLDENTNPLAAGLGWTVAWEPADRDFIGRAALEAVRGSAELPRTVGLVLEDRGVLRAHQKVITPAGEGEITSGGFAPTLEKSIALARVPRGDFDRVQVEVRNRQLNARIVKYPFVRHGQSKID